MLFLPRLVEPSDLAASNVIHRTFDHGAARLRVRLELLLQPGHRMAHVQAAGLVLVPLHAHGLPYLVGDEGDEPLAAAGQRGMDGAAAGVAQHHDMAAVEVPRRVLDAAQLVMVQHVPRHADDEQVSYARLKDLLRDHPGIGAADHDGIGVLPMLRRVDPSCGVARFDKPSVAFFKTFSAIHDAPQGLRPHPSGQKPSIFSGETGRRRPLQAAALPPAPDVSISILFPVMPGKMGMCLYDRSRCI